MGVYHLAPVGTSPGAVTSALSYLKRNQEMPEFAMRGAIVEAVILFPSWGVRDGEETTPEECVFNDYGQENKRRTWKRGGAVLDIIRDFVGQEFGRDVTLYYCPVNVGDYHDCFEKIAKVALKFGSGGGGTGKHLWGNLTGGPNIINSALLEVAFLSGLIARLYYTFISDVRRYGRYLQPPNLGSGVFEWREVPLIKTDFDEDYYRVVQILSEWGDWLEDNELLNRLAQRLPERYGGGKINLGRFRDNFLNKIDGREIEREELPGGTRTHRNRVTKYGRQMLKRIASSDLLQMVLRPNIRTGEIIERLTQDVNLKKL